MEFWRVPLDKVDGIPYINIVATRRVNGKFVALLCVNRSLEEDVQTNFDQGAMRVEHGLTGDGTFRVRWTDSLGVETQEVVPIETFARDSHAGGGSCSRGARGRAGLVVRASSGRCGRWPIRIARF